MQKYKILTDGGYEGLDVCIGKIVDGVKCNHNLVSILVTELINAGGEDLECMIDDSLFYYNNTEVEEIIE